MATVQWCQGTNNYIIMTLFKQ